MSAIKLALLLPAAAAFSFGGAPKTVGSPFSQMPGAYGWASEKGLAYSFGKDFSQKKFPGLVKWTQEAEIKHACVAMDTWSKFWRISAPACQMVDFGTGDARGPR